MFALKKLRARRAPGNQAHVTNPQGEPALLAADAAEAARRGFAEMETTVGAARYAPLNALALLVGRRPRPGATTQCAVEERRNLELAVRGLVSLCGDAVRLRHRGGVRRRRRHAVVEGAPRRRVRVARGEGPVHVRHRLRGADGRGAGVLDALPRGAMRVRRAGGRLAGRRTAPSRAWRSCSPCPAARARSWPRTSSPRGSISRWRPETTPASHSAIRKTAKLMGQFLPGTDFVTSGYSVMPRHDNTFGGGNYDADDIDEWLTVQRDWRRSMRASSRSLRTRCSGYASEGRGPCRRCSTSWGCRRSPTRRSPPQPRGTTRRRAGPRSGGGRGGGRRTARRA